MRRLAVPLIVLTVMVLCTNDRSPIRRILSQDMGHNQSVSLMVAILSLLGLITLRLVFRRINLIHKDPPK